MFDWAIGIDFGTSRSAGAVGEPAGESASRGGRRDAVRVSPLEIEGHRWISSAVALSAEGELVVGADAEDLAASDPERVEPTPKSALGQTAPLLLGGAAVDARDAAAAVIRVLLTEATLRAGGRAPAAAVLAHPARWAEARCGALRDAAEHAGLVDVDLVEEPVAAAIHYAAGEVAPGANVAVYDLGSSTFDTVVLHRTTEGFDLLGVPGRDEAVGGDRFDHLLLTWIGEHLEEVDPDLWDRLRTSDEPTWRQAARQLRAQARRAKEALSSYTSTQVLVPVADRDVMVNRSQFEAMIVDDVERTVELMADTVAGTGLAIDDLAAVYLVGGSSRIPLVAQLVAERFGQRVVTRDEPKSVVALGAARLGAERLATRRVAGAPSTGALPPPVVPTSALPSAAATIASAALPPPTSPAAETARHTAASLPPPTAPAGGVTPIVPQVTIGWRVALPPAAGRLAGDRHGVVVGDRDGGVYSFDGATGRLRWHTPVGSPVWTAPALDDDLVVVGALDGRVAALERATGAVRWMGTTGAPIGSTPAISDLTVIVADDAGTVYGLDRGSGALRWQLPVGSAVRADLVPVPGGAIAATVAGHVYSIAGATGACRWGYRTAAGVLLPPAVVRDRVLVPSDDGIVHGLDLATGTARYGVRCTGRCTTGVAGSLEAFSVVDESGVVRVHRADTGQAIAEIALAGVCSSTTGAAGVVLAPFALPTTAVVEAGGELIALDLATGTARFTIPTGTGNRFAPVVTGGLVAAGTTFGQLLGVVAP